MKLFLHLIISEEPPLFNSKWSSWIQEHFSNIQYFDLDQKSDASVVDTAVKALQHTKTLLVFIECDNSPPGQLLKVMKMLSSQECMIIQKGENHMLDKLSNVFGEKWHFIQEEEELCQLALNYFKNSD